MLSRILKRNSSTFTLQSRKHLPTFNCNVELYRHTTGLQWVHLDAATSNNVFSIGFKTEPSDSTGIPHILEHTALCGDPFFKMLNRSMATFMNAMTGDDMTAYPFSTQNKQDYYNLMDVYLDAVFFPKLNEYDFKQEGWRLEYENVHDNTSPIIFKGVVYNEMKGALADTSSLFYTRHQQQLYPGTTYSHVSGGDPQNITNLTHQELVAFHKKNYHPSNSIIYTYEQMEKVQEKIAGFGRLNHTLVEPIQRWTKPKNVVVKGPFDSLGDQNRQARVAVSYLTNPESDTFESFTLRAISDLLLDGAASPMYKRLIETKLGIEFAPTTGYNSCPTVTSMSFGLQGVENDKIDVVSEKILECLDDFSKQGPPKERISSVFHQIEIGLKHKTTQFGMNLGWNLTRNMFHQGDPLDALDYEKNLTKLKKHLNDNSFIRSKVNEYFINNPHRLTFAMLPDHGYADLLVKQEQERLNHKVLKLSENDKTRIYKEGQKLLKLQESKEDLSCLPCIDLQSVSREPTNYPLIESTISNVPVLIRPTDTNTLSYVYFKFDISHLNDNELMLALNSLGTASVPLAKLDEDIRTFTGGINASASHSTDAKDNNKHSTYLTVSSSCMPSNISEMYKLLHQCMFETDWTKKDELYTCLTIEASSLVNSITGNGHIYAMRSASASLTPSGHVSELLHGMTQVNYLNTLTQDPDITHLSTRLQEIAKKIFNQPEILIVTDQAITEHQVGIARIVENLSPLKHTYKSDFQPSFKMNNHPMDLGINFVAKSIKTVPYTHPDSPALKVLSSILTNHFLHKELREKGGAYGGGCRYNSIDGILNYMTYRDPIGYTRTLDTFKESTTFDFSKVSKTDLTNAKLDILKTMDVPIDTGLEGYSYFTSKVFHEQMKKYRAGLFDCTIDDLVRVQKYLNLEASACVIGESIN
ncbi:Presequence protease, mitochondrial [Boothiomyces macroporosus]|uniref:Presequence protease, mitochondrial n=1 Tax=Boothiomyces macroporosus TaxID=261099 RepID=A0AAD5UBT2_9FUNG|nr:Presequence protease, mitochondrial [Boothiomyces macroporosus]